MISVELEYKKLDMYKNKWLLFDRNIYLKSFNCVDIIVGQECLIYKSVKNLNKQLPKKMWILTYNKWDSLNPVHKIILDRSTGH